MERQKSYKLQTIVDFCKALEESNMFAKGSHKRPVVIKEIKKVVEMSEEQFNSEKNSPSVVFVYSEFYDWLETYEEEVA